jgi:hypothetical protein
MAIAKEYGTRLMIKSKNFEIGTLNQLIGSYPSHGFVIDREEAETKFKNVRACTDDERALLKELGDSAQIPTEPWVKFISDDLEEQSDVATQGPVLEQTGISGTPTESSGPIPPNDHPEAAAA